MKLQAIPLFVSLLTLVLANSLTAQIDPNHNPVLLRPFFKNKVVEINPLPAAPTAAPRHYADRQVTFRSSGSTFIGETVYDLQTNATTMDRLFLKDGKLSAVWTQGLSSVGGYPNRGTGYNYYDGTTWMDMPDQRLESVTRTGWPNIVVTADDQEFVLCHDFNPPVKLHTLQRNLFGSGVWSEAAVPHASNPGIVWPRLAVGGPDGNTIHALGITFPSGNGGTPYAGVDGHILYYRFQNGSWDKVDVIIPGLDSSRYSSMRPDAYSIHARGETVAVAYYASWGDVVMAKSTDNGDTWTLSTVHDFPLDRYEINSGYTEDDIPDDPDAPAPLAIQTSDNAGGLVIDHNGMVHLVYSETYVQDEDLGDAGWTYYPGIAGLHYWNESYGEDSTRVVAGLIDADGDGVFDVNAWGDYGQSILSFPTIGVDPDNRIFVAWSAVAEGFENENANPEPQNYRHIFVIGSDDLGESWTDPYDIINPDLTDPLFYEFFEAVFPSMAKDVDGSVHLIYQQDVEPGLSVQGADGDIPEVNSIVYMNLDVNELFFPTTTRELLSARAVDLEVFPNPAREAFTLSFRTDSSPDVEISLLDPSGRMVYREENDLPASGRYRQSIRTVDLPSGMYFLRLRLANGVVSSRILLE